MKVSFLDFKNYTICIEILRLKNLIEGDHTTTINIMQTIIRKDARPRRGYFVKSISIPRQYNVFNKSRLQHQRATFKNVLYTP